MMDFGSGNRKLRQTSQSSSLISWASSSSDDSASEKDAASSGCAVFDIEHNSIYWQVVRNEYFVKNDEEE